MEKALPSPYLAAVHCRPQPQWLALLTWQLTIVSLTSFLVLLYGVSFGQGIEFWQAYVHNTLSSEAAAALIQCRSLHAKPGPAYGFDKRTHSDRYVDGTKAYLLQNAKIWTGAKYGTEIIHGDILLDKGLIKKLGQTARNLYHTYKDDIVAIDVKNAWVTPGIIDMHSHMGSAAIPLLDGVTDTESHHGPILPWLRVLDGLNTHDDSYALSVSGGVTTALVLPGSENIIGGQAFTIKLRKTAERTPSAMLLEPPYQVNSSCPAVDGHMSWRQIKHACGEEASRVYGNTRMDNIWAFRQAYNKAREIKNAQDVYCAKVEEGKFDEIADVPFPQDLQWEALVDVLRGRVKVHVHCYEAVDFDDVVRLTNEFQFSVTAFHHAHEAYLVPDLMKKAYGHTPAVALFATVARYKREAYRGSEFAPRILAENGVQVVMKSDHPLMDSRYLLYEAQQAYLYGLPENLAIAAVTSTPAQVMGMDHRIGFVKEGEYFLVLGYDADLVIWDSHPLALGATPKQVFIDGIPQLENPTVVRKPSAFQQTPQVPNYDREAKAAVEYEGLPPLEPMHAKSDVVLFTNVKSVFTRDGFEVTESFSAQDHEEFGIAVVLNGKIVCTGSNTTCFTPSLLDEAEVVNLRGGSISPGLTTFGSPLGLVEIDAEDSTNDGVVLDPLVDRVPSIIGGDAVIVHAVDGLQFGGRSALEAYRSGVLNAITAPVGKRFYAGLSTTFSTGALSRLDEGAIIQDVNAIHVSIRHFRGAPSVSTQIGTLRRLLLNPPEGDAGLWFKLVAEGNVTLVVDTDSADIIATLIPSGNAHEATECNGRSVAPVAA